MSDFREREQYELEQLPDEELLRYVVCARAAGRLDAAGDALRILVFDYEPRIRAFVRGKVPSHAVEEVTDAALDSGFTSAFDESGIESFRAWIFTIARRRVADYHRRHHPDRLPIADEHEDDEDVRGAVVLEQDATGLVAIGDACERCLERLGSDIHRAVVELAVFQQMATKEVVEEINAAHPDIDPAMSAANVDQIKSRFRKCLKAELGDDGKPDG